MAEEKQVIYGPTIPVGENSEKNEISLDMIGPLPQGLEIFEELRHFKDKNDVNAPKCHPSKPLEREAWMTELPEKGLIPSMGLTARQFRTGASASGQVDHSAEAASRKAWTSVPGQENSSQNEMSDDLKSRKNLLENFESKDIRDRDFVMQQQVELINTKEKRNKSLMDLHRDKLKKENKKKERKEKSSSSKRLQSHKKKKKKHKSKKKKKKYSSSSSSSSSDSSSETDVDKNVPTRVAFDRDRDLRTNVLSAAQKNSIINRSQHLSSRFSSGSQQFL